MRFDDWIFLPMPWLAVVGLAFQAARSVPGLGDAQIADETRAAARTAVRRASLWAAGATAAILAAIAFVPEPHARWVLFLLAFAGFHTSFWIGGAPLLRLGRREPPAGPHRASRRVASLVVRDETDEIPRAAWAIPVVLVAAPVVAVVAGNVLGTGFTSRTGTTLAIVTAVAVVMVVPWLLWASSAASHPQDLSGAADPAALDAACRRFRRTLSRGIFGCACATALVAGVVGFLTLAADGDTQMQGRIGGIAGGVGGSLVGVCGGVLGMLADRRRREILDLGGTPPEPNWSPRRPA